MIEDTKGAVSITVMKKTAVQSMVVAAMAVHIALFIRQSLKKSSRRGSRRAAGLTGRRQKKTTAIGTENSGIMLKQEGNEYVTAGKNQSTMPRLRENG